jgi:general secretion pathway protein G
MVPQPSPQTRRVIELVNELAAGRIDTATYYRLSAQDACAQPPPKRSRPGSDEPSAAPAAKLPSWRMVLAIVVMIGLLIVAMQRSAARSDTGGQVLSAENQLKQFSAALEVFHRDTGRYPTAAEGLNVLVRAAAPVQGWHGPYLAEIPNDPWGQAYLYTPPTAVDPNPTVASLGQDGVASVDDVIEGKDFGF